MLQLAALLAKRVHRVFESAAVSRQAGGVYVTARDRKVKLSGSRCIS